MSLHYYELAARTSGPIAGSPYLQLYTAASTAATILEIGVWAATATTACITLVRTTTVGVASTSSLGQSLNPYNPSASSQSRFGTAWSTPPASGGNEIRRGSITNTIGAGFIWAWPEDAALVVAACSGIAIQNPGATGGSPLAIYIKWHE